MEVLENPGTQIGALAHNLFHKVNDRSFFAGVFMRKPLQALFLTAALCGGGAALAAVEVAGVKLEETITVAGTPVHLNGAGIRYKGPFKVYVGDLYTTKPVKSFEEFLAAPGPKRLTMTFLRDINSADFGKMLTRGIEDNTPKADMSKIIPGMIKMGDIFAANKAFAPGDTCAIEWDPAKGLSIWAKGKLQAEPMNDPGFFKALMAIWFGHNPADWKLKDALLGGK